MKRLYEPKFILADWEYMGHDLDMDWLYALPNFSEMQDSILK
jgi:hypothetical protein